MTRLLDFLASLATSFRIATYGPSVLETYDREEVDGQKAWEEFQAEYRRREESKSTQEVGKARKERKAIVHSALARSVPSRGVAA